MWGLIIILVIVIVIGVGGFFLFRYIADRVSDVVDDIIPDPEDIIDGILPFGEIGKNNEEFWDDEPKEI